MKSKILLSSAALALTLSTAYVAPAAAIVLPAPTTLIDGITTAIKYDDFWSYSNQVLRTIQDKQPQYLPVATYGDFGFATGTGGLDVILYTGSGTKDRNQGVGPDGPDAGNKGDYNFQDPVSAPAGGETSLSGVWGNGTAAVNGPVTVGQVLNYLHALNPNNNIPVFYMDMNQVGSAANLFFSGEVNIINPLTGASVHNWAMDNTPQPGDGTYDPASMTVAAHEIGPLIGASGYNYGVVDHNLGSGKADFIAYAPTMDLSLFDPNYLFVTHFEMANLSDGFEEIFLTGNITTAPVPEPGTMMLLGMGMLGLAVYGKRRMNGK